MGDAIDLQKINETGKFADSRSVFADIVTRKKGAARGSMTAKGKEGEDLKFT